MILLSIPKYFNRPLTTSCLNFDLDGSKISTKPSFKVLNFKQSRIYSLKYSVSSLKKIKFVSPDRTLVELLKGKRRWALSLWSMSVLGESPCRYLNLIRSLTKNYNNGFIVVCLVTSFVKLLLWLLMA